MGKEGTIIGTLMQEGNIYLDYLTIPDSVPLFVFRSACLETLLRSSPA